MSAFGGKADMVRLDLLCRTTQSLSLGDVVECRPPSLRGDP